MVDRPIGIDLFAGAGGMSLGFEQAGFDVVAAVEIDPIHASVHHYNFPNCRTLAQSVSNLSGQDILRAAHIQKKVDVVFGGAPCQGFSLIGQRTLEDPRNQLVKDFIRLTSEIQPKYFVFENVKGITVGKHKKFLDELIHEFEAIGYNILIPWQILNAKHYGVPQNRERLFLIGAHRGYALPAYPVRTTHTDFKVAQQEGIQLTPTVGDALSDLPDAERFPDLMTADETRVANLKPLSAYSKGLRPCDEDWLLGHRRLWDNELLTSSMRTKHTPISRERFRNTVPGHVEPISRFFKLDERGISNTLRAGTDSSRGAFTSPRPIHYVYPRCVTVREMARLHGFPDWFRFHTTKWHGARQIGNAVPPPLARAIATQITQALNLNIPESSSAFPLGEEQLLKFDMTAASKFWDISVPIPKRNRKSGAKKRRQTEIEYPSAAAGASL